MLLITVVPTDSAERRFRWFLSASMFLTLIGYSLVCLALWNPEVAAGLLRFYWFRMSDVFIPLGVSIVGLRFVERLGPAGPAHAGFGWLA